MIPIDGLAVLNPGGRDPDQDFPAGAGAPGDGPHPPVNFHAFAACTGGAFLKSPERIGSRPTLLLLRGDLSSALRFLQNRPPGAPPVAVSFKETGAHQVAATLSDPRVIARAQEILALADVALAVTRDLPPLYHSLGARRAGFVPTPYPLEEEAWDFRKPPGQRRGIFVGTREFEVLSRRHLAALFSAKTLSEMSGEPVTVFNRDGRRGRALITAAGFAPGTLRVEEKGLPYPEYLSLMAGHRLVWQLDRSRVPGQVAGDALLCGLPCVGGDSAIEQIAYPTLCGWGRDDGTLLEIAAGLLAGGAEAAGESARRDAIPLLSFRAGAHALRAFFSA